MNVVMKLARGHVAYQDSEVILAEPATTLVRPIETMTEATRKAFETPPIQDVYPEIGSRAFYSAVGEVAGPPYVTAWHMVQPGRYRYLVSHSGQMTVRFVLSEYLACEVVW